MISPYHICHYPDILMHHTLAVALGSHSLQSVEGEGGGVGGGTGHLATHGTHTHPSPEAVSEARAERTQAVITGVTTASAV